MQRGICKLCKQEGDLLDSHFVPASIYRRMKSKQGDPIVMTPGLILGTARQVRDYSFCGECEARFSKGGEKYMASVVFQGEGKPFPFLEKVSNLRPLTKGTPLVFSGLQAGIDTEQLAYFAVSMVVKSAVHEWNTLSSQKTSLFVVPEHLGTMRRYLLGETGFPDDIVVVITACLDQASQYQSFAPASKDEDGKSFLLVMLGVYFHVMLGVASDSPLQNICCVHTRDKRVHVDDCKKESVQAFGQIHINAKIAKNVLGTPYAKSPKGYQG